MLDMVIVAISACYLKQSSQISVLVVALDTLQSSYTTPLPIQLKH